MKIDTATYCKIEKGEQVVIIADILQTDKEEWLAVWLMKKRMQVRH